MAAPATVEERRLVDDVDPAPHRLERFGLRGPKIGRCAQVHLGDLVDRSAACPKSLEIGVLVLVSALLEEHEFRVLAPGRPVPLSLDPPEFERREVVAGEEPDQVRGTDDGRAFDELHAGSGEGWLRRQPSRGPCQLACHRRSHRRPAIASLRSGNSSATAWPKTSVWRSTSASVVAGDMSAMLWNGVMRMPRFRT